MLTKIPKNKQLIIFDFYDTLMYSEYHNRNFLRTGINDLVNKLIDDRKILVISSDADVGDIRRDFGYAAKQDFMDNFKDIYGSETTSFDTVNGKVQKYKDLGNICRNQNIPFSQAIFIGDNYNNIDEYSAKKFNIDYIIVPKESKDFSFISLI